MQPLLQLSGISKRFGGVEALRDVSFTLAAGEIHALLGENGAGKSTLMNIVVGLLHPDAGEIAVNGVTQAVGNPLDARRLGIGMVHQHFTSIPAFTVAENVALATGWRLRPGELSARVRKVAGEIGWDLDPDAQVQELSAGLKQRLEVVKALATNASILLLDEPSSVLSPVDADALLSTIQGLRARGVSSVLITHKLSEAVSVADRVTVLRRGEVVHEGAVAATTSAALAVHMLGAPPPKAAARSRTVGETRVTVDRLVVPRMGSSGSGLREASFTAQAGEIVGIAAVEGNGERELLRAIAGLVPLGSGAITVASPVAFIPEDRTTEALIGEFSLTENLILSQGAAAPWAQGAWLDRKGAERRTTELIEQFAVRAAGPEAMARSLSGGNQQRMVIAGALERNPAVLIGENVTRGLDLRATAEIHERLRQAAAAGVCVLLHLADLDELLELSDRILVMANGVLSHLAGGATRLDIGRRMLGVAG